MDVTKSPPPADITSLGVGTATNAAAASQSNAAAGASTASSTSTALTAVADRVDIQPLDVSAALQIMIAEVRAELLLAGASLPDLTQQANPSPALQAAEIMLAEMPEAPAPAAVSTDATASPSPASQPAGLALLESQAKPLSPSPSAEPSGLPNILWAAPSEPPTLVPMPEAPDPAAVTLPPAVPVGVSETATGVFAAGIAASIVEAASVVGATGGSGAGPGSAVPPLPSPLFTTPALLSPQAPPGMGPPRMGPPWMGPPWVGPPGSSDGTVGGGMASEPLTGGRLPLAALLEIPASVDSDPLQPLLMPPGARVAMPSALTLLSSPAQAAPALMRMFLQAVPPEASNPAAWSAIANHLEGTLQSALDRAVATVEQWHDVPQVVVDAARETRGLVMTQLGEEPPGPFWPRPEWMWLSPQMERFRRRRRLARRGLSDPDLWPLRADDGRAEAPDERKEEP
jgi:hypothetical protein